MLFIRLYIQMQPKFIIRPVINFSEENISILDMFCFEDLHLSVRFCEELHLFVHTKKATLKASQMI